MLLKDLFSFIYYFGVNSRYWYIYISDVKGAKYSHSLKYNVRSIENQCDFEKVIEYILFNFIKLLQFIFFNNIN